MGAVPAEPALVRIFDLAGRPRGTGFLADELGTVITSHEAVDGLSRVVVDSCDVHDERGGPGGRVRDGRDGRSRLAESEDITPLPERNLALIRTEGLDVAPLVIGAERAGAAGTPVRLLTEHTSQRGAASWTDARLAGTATVTYTSTDRFHTLEEVVELALPEEAAVGLHLSRQASGSPVLDARTGAVLAVLGTALRTPSRAAGFAVPLRAAGLWEQDGPLGSLVARNGATVPGFGQDLNLAGVLRLTDGSVRQAVERTRAAQPVHRPEVADELSRFMGSGASVAALVGDPGTGRTTELAAFAARRTEEAGRAPTVWLRGAELRAGDGSVREAVARALAGPGGGGAVPSADVVARLARDAKRPLVVLLDAPEEMPVRFVRELRQWTAGTASWLRACGARMVIACGPEHWEQAGQLYPSEVLHDGDAGAADAQSGTGSVLPPCVRTGDLPAGQAARLRERYGLDEGALAAPDAGHPLAARMLGEVRHALGDDDLSTDGLPGPTKAPARWQIFTAYLDLVALRIGGRLAAERSGTAARERTPAREAGAVRRLAARASGALHEAARRCLGPGQGALGTADFEQIFPRSGGWARAVLAEGVLEPAGEGFRFSDEEFADWLQGRHLDLDEALRTLVRGTDRAGAAGATAGCTRAVGAEAAVPHHRIGPVVQALLLCERAEGPAALERRLLPLAEVCAASGEEGDAEGLWWATRLVRGTLLRVPDVRPYGSVLRTLAERIAENGDLGEFGAWFWRRLTLPAAQKVELLRLLLPADPPYSAEGRRGRERCLEVVDELAAAEPETVVPLLCAWFTDRRRLSGAAVDCGGGTSSPTVASAAQALLYAHRRRATELLLDLLIDACHPRADELLRDLVEDEPAALCSAVERWAHDEGSLRRSAAAEFGTRMTAYARTDADRAHLEAAARALLRHSREPSLHTSALALLLRVSAEPDHHLGPALDLLAGTGSAELSETLACALRERPQAVLAAFRARLCEPGSGAHHLVETLASVAEEELARPTAELVREYAELRPETAGEALAAFVRHRLAQGPQGSVGLRLLTDALLCTPYPPLRACLARALGEADAGPVRDELLNVLLVGERDAAVLHAARRRGSSEGAVPRHGTLGPANHIGIGEEQ